MKRRSSNFKVLLISVVMALLFIVVGANVFIVSVLGYHVNSKTNIKEIIEGIHVVDETIVAERGNIVDQNDNIIATNKNAYTLYAIIDENRLNSSKEPAYVVDKEKTAQVISDVIKEDPKEILAILNQKDKSQVEFGLAGKKISLEQKEKIESHNLPGLGFIPVLTRHYPNKNFASSLIGISLFDDELGNLTGRFGIELNYEKYLKGENGHKTYQQDKDGYILPQVEVIEKKAKNGADVKLTLDRTIQESLEDALKRIANDEGVKAKELWGAVMEAKTGKIVAWSDYPNFDPNKLDIKSYENKGSQFTYEPGSTMKTFTVAAAIEEGVYNGKETFDSGPFYVGDKNGVPVRLPSEKNSIATITNAMNIDYGYISYDYGYDMSSNVMIGELLTKKLDPEVFHDYLYKLGFFEFVDTDKIPENEGYDLWNYSLEKITNGFGQGSTVTMLQMLQAYSSLVTDGTMVKPYFVDEIINHDTKEVIYKGKTTAIGKPFKESTALQVRDMMRTVVSKGSATRFDIDEIEVIGKTGTAQMVIDGKYSARQYIFSSALAFPYNEPEYILYYAYTANYGHDINYSARHVNDVVRKVVSTYGLKDEYEETVVEATKVSKLPQLINQDVASVRKSLESKGYKTVVLGDGKTVIDQYPKVNSQILSNELVMLYTNSSTLTVPNMKGWSRKEVNAFSNLVGVNVEIEGSGYVQEQSIPKGKSINKKDLIKVKLK
ncbi:penicillin-binding protein [Erysipelothrix urinaevulpis]|uniref:penicillin-binding protein n=1 Tax=Erysipelothrix urinaevulpis TaxID=2683717 RepID=UPI001F1A98DE|nr:penicillin-binding protein [Erysipelothrix urinaevulpis]